MISEQTTKDTLLSLRLPVQYLKVLIANPAGYFIKEKSNNLSLIKKPRNSLYNVLQLKKKDVKTFNNCKFYAKQLVKNNIRTELNKELVSEVIGHNATKEFLIYYNKAVSYNFVNFIAKVSLSDNLVSYKGELYLYVNNVWTIHNYIPEFIAQCRQYFIGVARNLS